MWQNLKTKKPMVGQRIVYSSPTEVPVTFKWSEKEDQCDYSDDRYEFYRWCSVPPEHLEPIDECVKIVDNNITAPRALHALIHKLLDMQRRPSISEEAIQQTAINVLKSCEQYFSYGITQ